MYSRVFTAKLFPVLLIFAFLFPLATVCTQANPQTFSLLLHAQNRTRIEARSRAAQAAPELTEISKPSPVRLSAYQKLARTRLHNDVQRTWTPKLDAALSEATAAYQLLLKSRMLNRLPRDTVDAFLKRVRSPQPPDEREAGLRAALLAYIAEMEREI